MTRKLKTLGNGKANPAFSSEKKIGKRQGFVGYDGEGWNLNDSPLSHAYTLLMNSEGEFIYNEHGLSSEACFTFLCECAEKRPHHHHVAFASSYDCNMMFRDIPRGGYTRNSDGKRIFQPNTLEALHAGYAVQYKNFEIEYRARKSLKIRRFDERNKWKTVVNKVSGKKEYVINWKESMVLYDVFGFFQSSFVNALKSYMGEDYERLAFIERMKQERGGESFNAEHINEIKEYCHAECQMLVDLMTVLRQNFETAGLFLTRWDGAGAAASALLKREGIKEHKEQFPSEIQRAAEYAYAGGRIETLQYGHIAHDGKTQRIWHYDIRSAYPYGMTLCPSLKDGSWETVYHPSRTQIEQFSLFTLYRVRWELEEGHVLYPFFYRTPIGNILYPQTGANYVWGPELLAALQYHNKGITVELAYVFHPASSIMPFAFLPELFALRAQWKKSNDLRLKGAEKAIKLSINSLYGKLAQRQGMYDGKSYQKPPFHQIEWAGFTTSMTRARLYELAMRAPHAVISIQTDGITATQPLLSKEELGEGLGSWEYEAHAGMTQVVSGVYWLDDFQADGSIKAHIYCRGFEKKGMGEVMEDRQDGSLLLSRDRVLWAWQQNEHVLPCTSQRFITLGSALAGDDQFAKWHTFHRSMRHLQLDMTGTKRTDIVQRGKGSDYLWKKHNPSSQLIGTRPTENIGYISGIEDFSTKHSLPWDDVQIGFAETEEGVDPHVIEQEIEDTYY